MVECIYKYSDARLFIKSGDVLEIKFECAKSTQPALNFILNGKDLGDLLINPDVQDIGLMGGWPFYSRNSITRIYTVDG